MQYPRRKATKSSVIGIREHWAKDPAFRSTYGLLRWLLKHHLSHVPGHGFSTAQTIQSVKIKMLQALPYCGSIVSFHVLLKNERLEVGDTVVHVVNSQESEAVPS